MIYILFTYLFLNLLLTYFYYRVFPLRLTQTNKWGKVLSFVVIMLFSTPIVGYYLVRDTFRYLLIKSGIMFWYKLNFTDQFNNKAALEKLSKRDDLEAEDLIKIQRIKNKYKWQ